MGTKVELTPEQIRDLYNAGVRRGESEQSAYEWGCRPQGKREDEMTWDLADILGTTVEVAAEILGALADKV